MRIRAERDELAEAFGRATRAVGVRTALPILQGVRCEARGSSLQVTGTDLEMTVRTSVAVEVMEEGEVVLPARLATEAIRKLPAGAVVVGREEGSVEISGSGPRFSLRELQAEEFPRLGEPEVAGAVDVDGEGLEEALGQVVVAASGDAARPVLTGVLFEASEQGLRLVATDSYRLALREIPGVEMATGGLIPARGLREFGRTVVAPKVQVKVGEREAVFQSERGTLSLRLVEGAFPNYRQLLPDGYPNRLVVEREDILDALGRATLVAEDHIPVRLKMGEGGAEVTVSRQDVGGEKEMVEGDYEGEEVTIAFNPRYFTDGVTAVGADRIEIQVLDGLKPAVIRGEGVPEFVYLLMPVRT